MRFALFIDYDNLLPDQKHSGLLAIATRVLHQLPQIAQLERGSCDVRLYGGWFEGNVLTTLAQDVIAQIQSDFPTVVRVPRRSGQPIPVQLTANLAVALLEDPAHHLFNTYRKKGKPANLRVQDPATIGCTNAACPLPTAKKLLRSGKCPQFNCAATSDDLVYRHEQKIVDTMLACDLIYASELDYQILLLVSEDSDFLPPLRTLVGRGCSVICLHPRPNGQRHSIVIGKNQLIEVDL